MTPLLVNIVIMIYQKLTYLKIGIYASIYIPFYTKQ